MKKYKIHSPKISHAFVPLKGLVTRLTFFKASWFLSFQPALLNRKLNIKILLASLTLVDSPNNFINHRRLLEHLLES
jgi:hypothetical protein